MAITEWIDTLAGVWGTMDDGKGGLVRSYAVFERAEYPESISVYPCALTYVTRLSSLAYPAGGPQRAIWQGVTELHAFPTAAKGYYPELMLYYGRIIRAAAGVVHLGGLVEHFLLAPQDPVVPGLLRYGAEDAHLGLIINWTVKEALALTVSA